MTKTYLFCSLRQNKRKFSALFISTLERDEFVSRMAASFGALAILRESGEWKKSQNKDHENPIEGYHYTVDFSEDVGKGEIEEVLPFFKDPTKQRSGLSEVGFHQE